MKANDLPVVSIIIPHWKGKEILLRCLSSLRKITYQPVEILLVDNGSTDGSIDEAGSPGDNIRIIRSKENRGYAGGCNLGLKEAAGEFALLLNDDAVVTDAFLEPLVDSMKSEEHVAGVQPKICSIRNPKQFDYAGAAGGYLDFLGFPFCRGRIFDAVEQDSGQYDAPVEIAWASGACCLLRMSALSEVGFLDEDFFAHMEEIDLQWRLRSAGYRIMAVPASTVFHEAGSTLSANEPLKIYLNHRNSLMMLLKNHRASDLAVSLPLRLLLDGIASIYRLFRGEWRNMIAVIRAVLSVIFQLPRVVRKRDTKIRVVLYPRSIVWDYFVRGKTSFSMLSLGAPKSVHQ